MKVTFKTEKQKDPTVNDGFSVRYGPAKRFAFKTRWYFLLALVLSPLLIFAVHIFNNKVLITADGILTTNPIVLNAPQTAYIDSIKVKPGSKVDEKQTLMKMSSPLLETELSVLTDNFKRIKEEHLLSLNDLKSLHLKKINLFKENMESQQSLSEEYSAYNKQGVLPLNEKYLIAENTLTARSRYEDALADYESIIIEHNNGSVAKTILELELAVSKARIKDEMLKIKAPKNAKAVEVLVEEGAFVLEGEPLISISNLGTPEVHVYLSPKHMNYARMGQTAEVKMPNGDSYLGVITQPTQMAKNLPSQLSGPFENNKSVIKVTLDISPTPPVILEGMPVEVRFHYRNKKIEQKQS
jgi:multidrug efflux pump subunit AcrA (membrane-fusion protein)